MRSFIAPTVAVSFMLGVVPSFAQGLPTTDELIKALTPNSQTRGLRIMTQPDNGVAGSATLNIPPAPSTMDRRYAAVVALQPVNHTPASLSAHTAPAVDLTVNFATGSAELTPQARQVLDRLGEALSSETLAKYRFKVAGHTDTVGTREYNKALSAQRAAVVVAYVTERFGVPSARMEPIGLGSDNPVISTGDQVPEARNRRVEIVNLGV
jgi:OmpA-OmpF porin, OOP family